MEGGYALSSASPLLPHQYERFLSFSSVENFSFLLQHKFSKDLGLVCRMVTTYKCPPSHYLFCNIYCTLSKWKVATNKAHLGFKAWPEGDAVHNREAMGEVQVLSENTWGGLMKGASAVKES